MGKSALDKFFDEHYAWRAAKEKHRERTQILRRAAQKEYYKKHTLWFHTLDYIGMALIVLNIVALLITGILVVKDEPTKTFVEANPTQCEWNGWSCHEDAKAIFIPLIRQFIIWAVLIALYMFVRSHTINSLNMWILTAIIIFYAVTISWDTTNDLGLYIGKLLYGANP